MKLSDHALKKLKEILRRDIGEKALELFSDEDLNAFGVRLLKLTAITLKESMRVARSS